MKHIFIGDIHGKHEQVKRALDMEGKKYFVGDIIDSWDRSPLEHSDCYSDILEAVAKGDARIVYGNHELSYLLPHLHKCSGWHIAREQVVYDHKKLIEEYFENYIHVPELNVLVTHAGLSQQIFDAMSMTVDNYLTVIEESLTSPEYNQSPLHWIGNARGGMRPCGGIFWCDYQREFKPIPGINQIFGHSRVPTITLSTKANSFNFAIDCLDTEHEFLTLESD